MTKILSASLLILVSFYVLVQGQAPPPQSASTAPAFEVASIKRNKSTDGLFTVGLQPGGRMNFVGVPVRTLIVRAFGVQPNQVVGGPDWITSDRFDVVAKAETNATPAEMNVMLQSLLADRFRLVAHNETRQLSIYELVMARNDRKLGPELKPATVDCGPQGRGRLGGPAPGGGGPPPGPSQGARGLPPPSGAAGGPGAGCRVMFTIGRIEAGGQPLALLTTQLSNQLGRPVIDKTGLTGSFDYTLSWTPDQMPQGQPPTPPPGAPPFPFPPVDPNGPTIFAALQEQLGVKLESTKGPVDVLVIDRIEPPTED
jgi:uncharacterized protein (TIGR03435 family)